jgi:rare lipoprotein A (peptidoglycan hydrolase)
MRGWSTEGLRFALLASWLAAVLCVLTPAIVGAADNERTADNTTAAEPPHGKNRQPKSKSSQSQGTDTKRAKVTLPTRDDTAPSTMDTKGLRGKASFYSPRFQGRKTASGDIFNNKLFTAASNLIPLGTLVAVRRPDTNLCVVVKVNDRMHPKHQSRVIDLSHSAAKYLDMVRDGVVKVQIMKVPANATEGSTIDCAMGYELEEVCENCDPPLQFLNN